VQIFENKGSLMGNSNPHPHCQIWAQESLPVEPAKELKQFNNYYRKNNRSILSDYLKLERKLKDRIVYENSSFTVLVPFWAVWPFETLIISKRKIANILKLTKNEKKNFADSIKIVTVKYDNLFRTSFPYSAGIHQAPTDGKKHEEWHLHMHFYPPLLRSAEIKKFMVGYEMLSEPQRDITPESSAGMLRELPDVHYKCLNRDFLNV
jgi:UDPglucose--hexose-1-phosphate uridylyltransferase